MTDVSNHWATDTPISQPVPPPDDVPVLKDFDGFGFSMNGMVHNVSASDIEEMFTPSFAPEGFLGRDDTPGLDIQPDDEPEWTEEGL